MPVKKETVKKVVKTSVKKVAVKAATKTVTPRSSFSVPVYSLAGRAAGSLALPKEIFGVKVNKTLLAQAIRVYTTNQKTFTASTKTRGQVEGSTAKIYRQKGTGRARHGAIRAPIFVGGGIVFGPTPRKVRLNLPKKMKKVALFSALSAKMADKQVIALSGVEKATGKTKEIVKLMSSVVGVSKSDKRQKQLSALILTDGKTDNVVRAVKNIPGVDVLSANMVNAHEILKHSMLLITKEAVEIFTKEQK